MADDDVAPKEACQGLGNVFLAVWSIHPHWSKLRLECDLLLGDTTRSNAAEVVQALLTMPSGEGVSRLIGGVLRRNDDFVYRRSVSTTTGSSRILELAWEQSNVPFVQAKEKSADQKMNT